MFKKLELKLDGIVILIIYWRIDFLYNEFLFVIMIK